MGNTWLVYQLGQFDFIESGGQAMAPPTENISFAVHKTLVKVDPHFPAAVVNFFDDAADPPEWPIGDINNIARAVFGKSHPATVIRHGRGAKSFSSVWRARVHTAATFQLSRIGV